MVSPNLDIFVTLLMFTRIQTIKILCLVPDTYFTLTSLSTISRLESALSSLDSANSGTGSNEVLADFFRIP